MPIYEKEQVVETLEDFKLMRDKIMDERKAWVTGEDIKKNKIGKGCAFKLSLCSKLCMLWDDENQTCLIRRLIVSLLNEESDD